MIRRTTRTVALPRRWWERLLRRPVRYGTVVDGEEHFFYDRVLSTEELAEVHGYLREKYGE